MGEPMDTQTRQLTQDMPHQKRPMPGLSSDFQIYTVAYVYPKTHMNLYTFTFMYTLYTCVHTNAYISPSSDWIFKFLDK